MFHLYHKFIFLITNMYRYVYIYRGIDYYLYSYLNEHSGTFLIYIIETIPILVILVNEIFHNFVVMYITNVIHLVYCNNVYGCVFVCVYVYVCIC